MNVDELAYRGMLIPIQLDVSLSVFLLVCTIVHLCMLPVNVLGLCAWVSVFREEKWRMLAKATLSERQMARDE